MHGRPTVNPDFQQVPVSRPGDSVLPAACPITVGTWELLFASGGGMEEGQLVWSDDVFRMAGLATARIDLNLEFFLGFVHRHDREEVTAQLARSVRDRQPRTFVHRLLRADGEERVIQQSVHVIPDPATEEVMGIFGTSLDITEQQVAEQALRASEKQFASAFEHAAIGMALVAQDGRFIRVNRSLCSMLGYSEVELLSESFQNITHPDDLDADVGNLRQLLEGTGSSYQMEKRYIHRAGHWVWALLSVSLVKDDASRPLHFISQIQDITERKNAESEIRRTSELLRSVAEGMPAAVFVKDLQGRYLMTNRLADQFAGIPGSEVLGRDDLEVFGGKEAEEVMAFDQQVMRSRTTETFEETLALGGRKREYLTTKAPYFDGEGNVIGIIGISRDISQRKIAENKIREQATLLDKSRDAIFVRDLRNRVVYWNQSAERLYGWTSEEAVGRSLGELLYPNESVLDAATASTLERGEWVGQIQPRTKGGKIKTVEGHWSLVLDNQGRPESILSIETDITERRFMELQFLRAQRLESIGTLAGGIAHDLNNVLAPIMMSIDLLRGYVDNQRGKEILDMVASSAKRGAEMVSQVLTFAKGAETTASDVSAMDVIRDVVRIVDETFPKNIRASSEIVPDLWAFHGDETQIHQVLLNLCLNARDAMPSGGRLVVGATNVVIDEHYAGMNLEASEGPYLMIQIEDTGQGMSSEVIEKLFDPFFTTKEPGQGTGLGLSTSLAIVKGHGGFIRVYSEPGAGSVFRIYLPAVVGVEADVPKPKHECPVADGGGEVVLVVDDEESIRKICKETLEKHGYRVLLAENGRVALSVYREHAGEVSMVLTDMMMPEWDGLRTMRELRLLDPEIRIICASGIGANGTVAAEEDAHFLAKPFTAVTLLAAIRNCLDEVRQP